MDSDRDAPPKSDATGAQHTTEQELRGIAGSGGIAIGKLVWIGAGQRPRRNRAIASDDVEPELERFVEAVAKAKADIAALLERARLRKPGPERSILEAYTLMLGDDLLRERVECSVRQQLRCVEWCLDREIQSMAAELRATTDAYLSERGADIESVGQLLQAALSEVRQDPPTITPASQGSDQGVPTIVLARSLSPAQIAAFDPGLVAGIVTETGTATAHTAIVARALGIPAVVGCAGVKLAADRHCQGIVDGTRGRVLLSPTPERLQEAERRSARRRQRHSPQQATPGSPRSACGTPVELFANTEFPREVDLAMQQGAGGIGLYRTEFLCADYGRLPNEEEQLWLYRDVLRRAGGAPVTFRTFDVGGDKVFGSQVRSGPNSALGLRGIRWSLQNPHTLLEQLRAITLAAVGHRVSVLLPMVSSASELREARRLQLEAHAQLRARGESVGEPVPLGCMVEVPAAALGAEVLAKDADFLSVGTNDLTQYVCAADRGNPLLAELGDSLSPAVLRLVKGVVDAGQSQRCPVSLCGAMASDPVAVIALLGLGVRQLSLEASALIEVGAVIQAVSLSEAQICAAQALSLECAGDVRDLVRARFTRALAHTCEAD